MNIDHLRPTRHTTESVVDVEPDHLRDRVLDVRQLARIDQYRLDSGDRRVRLTAAAGFDVEILPDRGMDLAAVAFRGIPLGFSTPALFTAPPPDTLGESFARRFGAGLLTTCGLDSYGLSSTDLDQILPQHGRATDLSADPVTARSYWHDGHFRLEVSGEMRQWRLFGEDLGWHRTIRADLGGSRLQITDEVENLGRNPWPHMMLYHINFGYPLLDEGTRITVHRAGAFREPVPRNDDAVAGLPSWSTFPAPSADFAEQVFRHDLQNDDPGVVTVINDRLGLSVDVQMDPTLLPHVFQWTMARAGTYALGIEPGNVPTMDGRSRARALAALPHLEPNETRTYTIALRVQI